MISVISAAFWLSTAIYDDCELIYEAPALWVRSPGPNVIFIMKLHRADPQDREDLVVLWPLCSFSDADDAANAFRLAYPRAPEDEHLADYIADVARDASPSWPGLVDEFVTRYERQAGVSSFGESWKVLESHPGYESQ